MNRDLEPSDPQERPPHPRAAPVLRADRPGAADAGFAGGAGFASGSGFYGGTGFAGGAGFPGGRWHRGTAVPGVVGLRDLLRLLARNKLVLTLAALVGLLLGAAFAEIRPSRYAAEGLLVIETARLTIPELSPLASSRTVEPWGGRSEARILTARETVAAAVDALGLVDEPAFNPTLNAPFLARLGTAPWLPEPVAGLIQSWAPRRWLAHQPSRGAAERAAIINGLKSRLEVWSEERSYAITLGFQGPTADLSAAVVNAVMQAYVSRDRAAKRADLAEATGELQRRLEEIGGELARARLELGALEGRSELVLGEGGTIRARNLDALLGEAQGLRIEQERVRADIERVEAALGGRAEVVLRGAIVTPTLTQLWSDVAGNNRDLAEARQTLGPRHPTIRALEAKLAGLEREIAAEVRSILGGLQREAELLDQRAARLDQLIAEAEDRAGASAAGRVDIELARQEVQSLQSLHDLYRERYEQTLVSPALISADARIVSVAEPPTRPSGPGRKLLAGLGGLIGLVVGAGLVVARRWLGERLLDPGDIERGTGLAVLGVLPITGRRRRSLADAVIDEPDGVASETLRAMLAGLRAPQQSQPPQILLVSSPSAGDGKTSFSLAAARVAVREGLRCLVVEGDYKRPGLRRTLGSQAGTPGDERPSDKRLPYTIVVDQAGGGHVLVAENDADLVPSLLRGDRLKLLFANARSFYDLIIIDAPPLLATADALLLAEHADAALLVAACGRTDAPSLATAADRLAQSGCPLAGVVLNRCPAPLPKTHSFAGYAPAPRHRASLVSC